LRAGFQELQFQVASGRGSLHRRGRPGTSPSRVLSPYGPQAGPQYGTRTEALQSSVDAAPASCRGRRRSDRTGTCTFPKIPVPGQPRTSTGTSRHKWNRDARLASSSERDLQPELRRARAGHLTMRKLPPQQQPQQPRQPCAAEAAAAGLKCDSDCKILDYLHWG
jgi:hypothetical protein